MRGTNVIGLIVAIFLCIALSVNGVLQDKGRSKYKKVEAKVVKVKDVHYSGSGDEEDGRHFYIAFEYYFDGKSYDYSMRWDGSNVPHVNSTRTLYIDPNKPEIVMDSGVVMREIGTFGFAGVSLVWAITQIYMGTKHAKSSADVRSSYFFLIVGLLITLSAFPIACVFYSISVIGICVAAVGVSVMGWGIKEIMSQKEKSY